ncbi:MAG TPA: GntR family transcriptional regulator [Usitatibacter sp.]|nr:GntR family transcriptional regulator [Usitatibacter sp.]
MENVASISPASPPARLLRLDVLRELREDIVLCRLPPGAELREAELAERFGVSKSPVRDALSRLVHEGLVIVMPRQGYRVASISLRDVRDMFEYRAVLEAACLRAVVRNASDEQLRSLDRFRRFDEAAYEDGFIGYNRDFHSRLAELCGNARLVGAVAAQMDQMDRVVTMSVTAMRRSDPARLVAQHGSIIDALQRRDARRAATLVERHIGAAQKRVCSALEKLAILE